VWKNQPIVLVPKAVARYATAYDHQNYYRHYVLTFLQAEAIEAGSSLVRTLKNKRRVVYKKDLQRTFPFSKDFLYRFSKDHPKVLERYRGDLSRLESRGRAVVIEEQDEAVIAEALATALAAIPPGNAAASEYHSLMIGALEFLLFPDLLSPKKENEIHQGRKRIDILMENGARSGIFHRLHDVRKLPCSFVPIECKNYTTDIANPELDQLAGRFSVNRGKFGFLCCRTFEDRAIFVERCRDTLRDDRGLIVPLDDQAIVKLLDLVGRGLRREVDDVLTNLVNEVWVS